MDGSVPRHLIAAVALCGCAAAAAEDAVWLRTNQELIHNAHFWEARNRGDLAQLALKKLVAARPDSPEALLELGELDLRLNEFADAAQVESELARRFKGSAPAREFATEYRIATRDRLQFASIRRLVEIGHTSEARAALERLFPQGAPGASLGIDYYLLLASTPDGLAAALAGIRRLARRHPDDPRYQLVLAQLMLRQRNTALAGLTLLQQLVLRDDVRTEDADRLLASGLLRLGAERAPARAIDTYLARHPEDAEVRVMRDEAARSSEARGLLSPATLSRVLPGLQQRLARDLESGPAAAQARSQARLWLDRSRGSRIDGDDVRAAAELRAALAFYRQDYESEIGIAETLESQGLAAEAGDLLASAARLAPQSTWLFETRVRWLIANGESTLAIELLRARVLGRKWTGQARDKLLAVALEQRASQEAQAGRVDSAISDLEAASRLAPRDPWMRYRLAEYYEGRGEPQHGRSLMEQGVRSAPDAPEMRYAQALYLSHLEDYAAACAAIEGIEAARRTEAMNVLHDRMQVALARSNARRLKAAGDLAGARTALLAVEPLATHSIDLAEQLAYSWIDLGSAEHGIGLIQPYLGGAGANDPAVLLRWARVLNSADDDVRLSTALGQLRTIAQLSAADRVDVQHLQRAHDLRTIRDLENQGKFAEAGRRLDALLASEPQDRQLRIKRADLYLLSGQPRAARDRYAALVAEDPDDLDTRLAYVRALTESGDILIARAQLQAVEERMPAGEEELHISLARRQLALDAAAKALGTLQPLLAAALPRPDVLMLAGRAELALRHFAQARGYFEQAAQLAPGPDGLAARRASQEIADRLESSVTAGLMVRHQPGSPGMSQIDVLTIPSAWVLARNYESHYTARADAVVLDAGRASGDRQSPPLIGTIQAAGPGVAPRFTNGRQAGLSPAVGYQSDSVVANIGSTPLGFLLPNIVGGIEWTPIWHSADLTFGLARRAVTSSELSYAGLRDPITGTTWGGVVQTGPYAGFGIYRENYDVSASVRLADITGTHVPDNRFVGVRLSSSWKLFARPQMRTDVGATVTYWNYQRNLSNYTFGSGGYYSPQSYVSVSTPIELTGNRAGWTYKARAAVSYSVSQVSSTAFYPDDVDLQAAATRVPLPGGYSSPYFPGYHSTGVGLSAYAAAERQVTAGLVVGVMLDIDRTDFYHPTTVEIYLRHAFGSSATPSLSPPRPVRPYSP
jgi:predicted Zn-dependent protease